MNKNNVAIERIINGIATENPIFIMMLGMCPTLAVTTSVTNGIGMGLSTTAVLVVSNLVISLVRKIIPDDVRLPAYIVIVASFVTVTQLIMQAYFVALNDSLGVYIPLIVVNCIILGRAEAYASKNPPLASTFDGIGMGIGFTWGLFLLSAHAFHLQAHRHPGQGTRRVPGPWFHCNGHERPEHQDQSQ